jgi:hypothetical protein
MPTTNNVNLSRPIYTGAKNATSIGDSNVNSGSFTSLLIIGFLALRAMKYNSSARKTHRTRFFLIVFEFVCKPLINARIR